MLTYIAFILSLVLFPFFSAAVAKLIYVVTQRGEIFGGWQKLLNAIHPKGGNNTFRYFWYKRLGGCITCMRQFIAEITFMVFINMWHTQESLPTFYIPNQPLRWFVNVFIFIIFCSVALTMGALIEDEKKVAEAAEEIITKAKPRTV